MNAGGRRVELALLLLAYALLVIAYQRAVPLFEGPDEQSHLHYLAFLATEHRLPGTRGAVDVPGEGMQPPLYYALLAPFVAARERSDPTLLGELGGASRNIYHFADRRSVPPDARIRPLVSGARRFRYEAGLEGLRTLRWGTLPFGMLAVTLTWAAVWRAFGSRPLALLGASLLAFSPQFVFLSSYVNNDVAGLCVGAAALYAYGARASRGTVERRDYLALPLLVALGVATKYSALPVVAATGLALWASDARPRLARRGDALRAAAALALLLAPLVIANWLRFGDPSGLAAVLESAATQPSPAAYGGRVAYLTHQYPLWTFQSYWARFGWMDLRAPAAIYFAFLALMGVGLLGFALAPAPAGMRRYLTLALLLTLGSHLWLNLRVTAPQGRHLFAAAPHLACMLAIGVARLSGGASLRVEWRVALGVSAALVFLTAYCLVAVVARAYA